MVLSIYSQFLEKINYIYLVCWPSVDKRAPNNNDNNYNYNRDIPNCHKVENRAPQIWKDKFDARVPLGPWPSINLTIKYREYHEHRGFLMSQQSLSKASLSETEKSSLDFAHRKK